MIDDPKNKKKGSYELTKKYTRTVKNLKEVAEKQNVGHDTFEDNIQGFTVDKKTSVATPKQFKRKVIRTEGAMGRSKIISDDGKTTLFEGINSDSITEKALIENEKNNTYTNEVRHKNADYYNLNSGSKKNLTNKDLGTLEKTGKAIRK